MSDGVVDTTKPASAGKTPPDLFADTRQNFAQVAIHIANTTDAHGIAALLASLTALVTELQAARGSRQGLTQRLDAALNPDGTLRVPVAQNNLSEWVNPDLIPTKVSDYSFAVSDDWTDIFTQFRRVKVQTALTGFCSMVQSSSYNAGTDTTTVLVYDAVVPADPTAVQYGFVTPGPAPAGSLDIRAITPTWLAQYNQGGF